MAFQQKYQDSKISHAWNRQLSLNMFNREIFSRRQCTCCLTKAVSSLVKRRIAYCLSLHVLYDTSYWLGYSQLSVDLWSIIVYRYGSASRVVTDGQTDATKCIISWLCDASRSIITLPCMNIIKKNLVWNLQHKQNFLEWNTFRVKLPGL